MKSKMYKKYKFLIPIVVITVIVTSAYMTIYANNPFMELASLSKTLMGHSNLDRPAPELEGIVGWFNSGGHTLSQLRENNKVVLLDFWTYACINCQRSIPHLVEWHEKYKDDGLVIIGVHTPEFRFEKSHDNVIAEMAKYPILYPVALDDDYKTWQAYQNHYWPAKYLVDVNGDIVYRRFGEGAYDEMEAKIVELLEEAKSKAEAEEMVEVDE